MSIPNKNELLRLKKWVETLNIENKTLKAENNALRTQRQQAIDLNIMLSHELAEIKAKYSAIQS